MRPEGLATALRVGVLLLSAVVLQRGLFTEVRIFDVSFDVLLALAIGSGMALGADRGAVVGFICGLLFDLMAPTPLGLSALTYCLAGYAVGRLTGQAALSSRTLRLFLVAGVSVAAVVFYALLAEVMGQFGALSGRLVTVVVIVTLGNVVMAPVARRAASWAWRDEERLSRVLR